MNEEYPQFPADVYFGVDLEGNEPDRANWSTEWDLNP
jgi:hypothetical protein